MQEMLKVQEIWIWVWFPPPFLRYSLRWGEKTLYLVNMQEAQDLGTEGTGRSARWATFHH